MDGSKGASGAVTLLLKQIGDRIDRPLSLVTLSLSCADRLVYRKSVPNHYERFVLEPQSVVQLQCLFGGIDVGGS